MYGSLTVAGTVMEWKHAMYTAGGLTLRGKYICLHARLLCCHHLLLKITPRIMTDVLLYVLHRALRDMQGEKRPEPYF
jgi:hypothetical protein